MHGNKKCLRKAAASLIVLVFLVSAVLPISAFAAEDNTMDINWATETGWYGQIYADDLTCDGTDANAPTLQVTWAAAPQAAQWAASTTAFPGSKAWFDDSKADKAGLTWRIFSEDYLTNVRADDPSSTSNAISAWWEAAKAKPVQAKIETVADQAPVTAKAQLQLTAANLAALGITQSGTWYIACYGPATLGDGTQNWVQALQVQVALPASSWNTNTNGPADAVVVSEKTYYLGTSPISQSTSYSNSGSTLGNNPIPAGIVHMESDDDPSGTALNTAKPDFYLIKDGTVPTTANLDAWAADNIKSANRCDKLNAVAGTYADNTVPTGAYLKQWPSSTSWANATIPADLFTEIGSYVLVADQVYDTSKHYLTFWKYDVKQLDIQVQPDEVTVGTGSSAPASREDAAASSDAEAGKFTATVTTGVNMTLDTGLKWSFEKPAGSSDVPVLSVTPGTVATTGNPPAQTVTVPFTIGNLAPADAAKLATAASYTLSAKQGSTTAGTATVKVKAEPAGNPTLAGGGTQAVPKKVTFDTAAAEGNELTATYRDNGAAGITTAQNLKAADVNWTLKPETGDAITAPIAAASLGPAANGLVELKLDLAKVLTQAQQEPDTDTVYTVQCEVIAKAATTDPAAEAITVSTYWKLTVPAHADPSDNPTLTGGGKTAEAASAVTFGTASPYVNALTAVYKDNGTASMVSAADLKPADVKWTLTPAGGETITAPETAVRIDATAGGTAGIILDLTKTLSASQQEPETDTIYAVQCEVTVKAATTEPAAEAITLITYWKLTVPGKAAPSDEPTLTGGGRTTVSAAAVTFGTGSQAVKSLTAVYKDNGIAGMLSAANLKAADAKWTLKAASGETITAPEDAVKVGTPASGSVGITLDLTKVLSDAQQAPDKNTVYIVKCEVTAKAEAAEPAAEAVTPSTFWKLTVPAKTSETGGLTVTAAPSSTAPGEKVTLTAKDDTANAQGTWSLENGAGSAAQLGLTAENSASNPLTLTVGQSAPAGKYTLKFTDGSDPAKTGTVVLTVTTAAATPAYTVQVLPAVWTLNTLAASQTFTAAVTDADGKPVSNAAVTWTLSGDAASLLIVTDGTVTLQNGAVLPEEAQTATLTATYKAGQGSGTGTATITVASEAAAEPSSSPSASQPGSSPSPTATITPGGIVPVPTWPGTIPTVPTGTAGPSTSPSGQPQLAPISSVPEAPIPDIAVEVNPDGSGSILTGVPISTHSKMYSAADLRASIAVPTGMQAVITDAAGAALPEAQPVGTGCRVEVRSSAGTLVSTATLVVKGDVTGTGELNIAQVVRLAKDMTGAEPLHGVYWEAGKVGPYPNDRINIADLVALAKMLVASRETT